MYELKPCPFCGTIPLVTGWYISYTVLYQVHCGNENCKIKPMTMMNSNKTTAVKEWNERCK